MVLRLALAQATTAAGRAGPMTMWHEQQVQRRNNEKQEQAITKQPWDAYSQQGDAGPASSLIQARNMWAVYTVTFRFLQSEH